MNVFLYFSESMMYNLFWCGQRPVLSVSFKTALAKRRREESVLAPGPETVDEDWQLSKDSADAATARGKS